jgi:hypothetical protein
MKTTSSVFYAFDQPYEAKNLGLRLVKPDFEVPLNQLKL